MPRNYSIRKTAEGEEQAPLEQPRTVAEIAERVAHSGQELVSPRPADQLVSGHARV